MWVVVLAHAVSTHKPAGWDATRALGARSMRVRAQLLKPRQLDPFAVQTLFSKHDVGRLVKLSVDRQVFDLTVCYSDSKHRVREVAVVTLSPNADRVGGLDVFSHGCMQSSLGFLASRSLIFSRSLGRQTWTSSPESSSALIQSHCVLLTTPFAPFNSTKIVPRNGWVMTRSGKPWLPVLGVIHLPGRTRAGWVCMTRQPCSLASVMTAF